MNSFSSRIREEEERGVSVGLGKIGGSQLQTKHLLRVGVFFLGKINLDVNHVEVGVAHSRIIEHQAALVRVGDFPSIARLLVELSQRALFRRFVCVHQACRHLDGDLADRRAELLLEQ